MYGVAAYLAWGFIAVYFKQVKAFGAMEILAHRIVWSVALVGIVVAVGGRWAEVMSCVRSGRTMLWLAGSTTMVAVNWYVFIWATTHGYMLQASLGYFINPLVNVLLGVLFLRERLRRWQLAGFALALGAVANLTIRQGEFPWISVVLALTFGFYGLLRKTVEAGPLVALGVETAILLPAGLWLAGMGAWQDIAGGRGLGVAEYMWLPLAGVVTAAPLLCFAAAARRLRLTTMGFLQYISPTCNMLLAVLMYGERLTAGYLASFCCIWAALAVYSADSVRGYWEAERERREVQLVVTEI